MQMENHTGCVIQRGIWIVNEERHKGILKTVHTGDCTASKSSNHYFQAFERIN